MFSLESTHCHYQYEKEKRTRLSHICSNGILSKGLKKEFEPNVVNEPWVFELLKFYCIYQGTSEHWYIDKSRQCGLAASHQIKIRLASQEIFLSVLITWARLFKASLA